LPEPETVGMARVARGLLLPLPLPLPVVLSAMTRWMRRSTVVMALLLSFTALPLTAWICVRCFRVVGDCRTRSVREGCWVVVALVDEDAGVERAMYMFEAVPIALVRRVVVPEMA
jgi:hypothetical protein